MTTSADGPGIRLIPTAEEFPHDQTRVPGPGQGGRNTYSTGPGGQLPLAPGLVCLVSTSCQAETDGVATPPKATRRHGHQTTTRLNGDSDTGPLSPGSRYHAQLELHGARFTPVDNHTTRPGEANHSGRAYDIHLHAGDPSTTSIQFFPKRMTTFFQARPLVSKHDHFFPSGKTVRAVFRSGISARMAVQGRKIIVYRRFASSGRVRMGLKKNDHYFPSATTFFQVRPLFSRHDHFFSRTHTTTVLQLQSIRSTVIKDFLRIRIFECRLFNCR